MSPVLKAIWVFPLACAWGAEQNPAFLSVSDYGCKANGIADDTRCLQQAFSAVVDPQSRLGRKLLIAPGTYKLSATITIQNVTGAVIEGSGGQTRFLWAGPRNIPMFHFANVRDSSVRDFRIDTNTAAPLQEGIRIDNVPGKFVDPGHNTWEGISMEGTNGGIGVCFREPNGGKDENNDFQLFLKNRCSNYSGAAWSLEHTQAFSSFFIDNQCYGFGHGQACIAGNVGGTAGSVTNFYWYGGFGGFNAKADFYINSSQQGITIQDFSSEGSSRFLITDGPSGAMLGITVDNLRWAANNITADGQFIVYKYPGPFVLRNSTWLGGHYNKAMKINWTPLEGGGARRSFVIENSTLVASNRSMASTFPNRVPTRMEGFSVQNSDTQFTSLDVREHAVTRVPVNADYTAGTWEDYLGVDCGRKITIKLPNLHSTPEPAVGKLLTIKDETGAAGGNNITILAGQDGLIDGREALQINTNYGFKTLLYIGNKKYVVVGQ